MESISIEIVHGNVLDYSAEILALKYAQDLYGADRAVYERLQGTLPKQAIRLPDEGSFSIVDTQGLLPCRQVLFVGVVDLYQFDYAQIRFFGQRTLESLVTAKSEVDHLALTLHGTGYGLDEIEAFESELGGLQDAVTADRYPKSLRRVTFVERDRRRAERLDKALDSLLDSRSLAPARPRSSRPIRSSDPEPGKSKVEEREAKPFVFVAMPYHEEMDDTFHYGIQGAVRAAGYICERSDQSSFVGDVMERVRQRISRASLIVADLTGANPNVFPEVGFAWGCGRPTVLLSRDKPPEHFDVRGQRCLVYSSIKKLEEMLSRELSALASLGF